MSSGNIELGRTSSWKLFKMIKFVCAVRGAWDVNCTIVYKKCHVFLSQFFVVVLHSRTSLVRNPLPLYAMTSIDIYICMVA